MTDTELSSKLYDKMSGEQDKFRAWLTNQLPADIMNHAVEYAVRQDILIAINALGLPDDQAKALLASPDTMADIYKTFSKIADTGHMDVIRDCIKERADTLIREGVLEQPERTKQEGVFLVDRSALLHMKEVQGGSFDYAVFDRQSKQKTAEGQITADDVMGRIDIIHDYLKAARDAAIKEAGLDGIEVAQVGLTSLKDFPESDIHRRSIWEPETIPKDDLRFIDSSYKEQFRIPNGGRIEVEYPDRTFSAPCEYNDFYHAYIGGELLHMYQFAELIEHNGGVCRPEAELDADQAAWKIGWDHSLAVERDAGQWTYHLFDKKMDEVKSGGLEVVGCSINEVRDMILAENKLGSRTMTPTDFRLLMEKAAAREQETRPEKKESVLRQLFALQDSQKNCAAPAPEKKHGETSR